ncbi:hypothetical protein DFH27DRAFT_524545 [Peziza echinospora]|nr:hypothetical protein DFH27DRAFT_524545 [Peziza echinospora]
MPKIFSTIDDMMSLLLQNFGFVVPSFLWYKSLGIPFTHLYTPNWASGHSVASGYTVFVSTYLPPDNSHSITYPNLYPVDLFKGLVNRYPSEDMIVFGDFNATLLFPDVCSRGHHLLLSLGAVDASVLNGTNPLNFSHTFLRSPSVSTLNYYAVSITLSPFAQMTIFDFLPISDLSPISLQAFVPTRFPSSSTPVCNALPHQYFIHCTLDTPSASNIEEHCILDSLPTDGISISPSTDCFF